mgnify:CR=1 FL=1|jgi:hypothetical protein
MLPGFEPAHSPALSTRATPVAAKPSPTARAAVTPTPATHFPGHGAEAAPRNPTLTSGGSLPPTASPAEPAAAARAAACTAAAPWWHDELCGFVHSDF